MRARGWMVTAAVIVLAAGGGVFWLATRGPRTAEEQFAVAEKSEKELRAEALTKSPKDLEPKIAQTIELYHQVGKKFGKSPTVAKAIRQIAAIEEQVAKDNAKALAAFEELGKEFTDEENLTFALMQQERLIRIEADALKVQKKFEEAGKRYRDAIAILEEYRKKFEKGKQADASLMEIGRIWQDGLENPLIRIIETFEKVLKDYPQSEFEPEAMGRLARALVMAKEKDRAMALYSQLIEQYPKSKWAKDAIFAQGEMLKEMEKHAEAAEKLEQAAQQFPDDDRAPQARAEAGEQRTAAEGQKSDDYGKSRYGGAVPYDTLRDKALPPAALLQQFTRQKLDAETYDLNVTFAPPENKMTVTGTLKLLNRGADKKQLLLLLGTGFSLTSLTVDGAEAKSSHSDEALQILLPAELKKDAEITLGFAYSGKYSDAQAIRKMMGPIGFGARDNSSATASATEPKPLIIPTPETSPATQPEGEHLAFNPQIALGEFGFGLSGAMWYPITIIGDVFDAHVTFTTPANVEAVANGELVNREKSSREGTPGRFEFQTKNPVFGLYFAYGPYTVQEKQAGSIHFYTYLRPANAAKHDAYVETTNRILSFYASKFVAFPFEKMAIIETDLPPILGGVGPASLMFIHDAIVARRDVPENLLAHELAHQWFGNLIPINITDPGYNQWLSEGFATYCDALYTQYRDGEEAFALHMKQYQQLYFQFALMSRMPPIKDFYDVRSPMYRPVVYEKGAIVLHMLRRVMGDDKFFRLMREFVETYRNKPTTVDDFRKLASTIHGEDLSWFFEEWIERSVIAHYKVDAKVSGNGPKSFATVVTVTQPTELVKMPVDVTLLGAKDEKKIIKAVMLDKKENVLPPETTDFEPVKVIVDEEHWVLRKLGEDNIWTPASPVPGAQK